MPKKQLEQEILTRSKAASWGTAVKEWSLQAIRMHGREDPCTCLCGHHPIFEVCTLHNHVTESIVDVGNCCVQHFMGLPSAPLFAAAKRVLADEKKALGKALVLFAHARRWISDWERGFCLDTRRKRDLTTKQMAKRAEINRRVLKLLRNTRTA